MKSNNNNLSAYKVIWAEFFPDYGIVTKHDRKQFGDIMCLGRGKTYRKHFASKAAALDYIRTFSKKLDKSYTIRMFTDKQFSLAKETDDYAIPYTNKQYAEIYNIG